MNASEKSPVAVCSACGAALEGEATACFHCGHTRKSPPLTKGQVISNRYELTGVLGRGGMGTVYEAQDRSLDERVALKVLSETAYGNADADRRFRAEIKLARKIRHPNVCAIHEYGELQDMQYIVMEFVDGQDLKKYVRSRGALTANEAIDIACQIGEGLQAIHEAGVIHRDLKLANVMRDPAGRLRLMDFGIAKGMGDTTATATGHIVGTPEYMSPEQARGEKVDRRSDVYALAIMTHELLTGRVPFKADTPLATMMMHVYEPPKLDDPKIPRGLVPVLRKGLAKTADGRHESALAFVAALRSALPALTSATLSSATGLAGPDDSATIQLGLGGATLPAQTVDATPLARPRHAQTRDDVTLAQRPHLWIGAAGLALAGLAVVAWLGFQRLDVSSRQRSASTPEPVAQPWSTALPAESPTLVPATPSPTLLGPTREPTPLPAVVRAAQPARPTATTRATATPQAATMTPVASPQHSAEPVAPTPQITVASAAPSPPLATPSPVVEAAKRVEAAPVPDTSASRPGPTAGPPAQAAAMALLVINVKPAAEIVLDGKVLGVAGAYTAPVTAGQHVIQFIHKNWQPLSRTVSLEGGERLKVSVNLKDEGIPLKK